LRGAFLFSLLIVRAPRENKALRSTIANLNQELVQLREAAARDHASSAFQSQVSLLLLLLSFCDRNRN
jgi:hypothetical protein